MSAIYKLVAIIIVVFSLVAGWVWQSFNLFSQTAVGFSKPEITFSILPGASLSTVANNLVSQNIISDYSKFMWLIKLEDKSHNVQAGEYVITPDMTPHRILQNFIAGKVKQYAFTIVEGWSFKQLLIALRSNQKIKHTLPEYSRELAVEFSQLLGLDSQYPEGWFLPDTYHFPAGLSDKKFLQRAYHAMQKVLDKSWSKRDKQVPFKSAYEALILASIVEKETGVAIERKQIAGVFIRRLEKKMRLQTDPTVIYGMGDSYKGNLRKKDLKKDTPYNTYRRKGLPPTPIALPGAAAINAVLHPKDDKSLYFVAKGDGSHYFSQTMKEHNKAVRKYQIRNRKANYRSAPKAKHE